MKSVFNPISNFRAFRDLLLLLTRYGQLTFEMAKREITDRYAGQWLGLFWTIGHPLTLMVVYAYVFGFVFRVKIGGTADMPLDYTTYILAGLIPWLAFVEAMSKSSFAIVGNSGLVKQFVFPIEILPVKGVIATLFTEVIFLAIFLVYILISQSVFPPILLILPVLIFLQTLAMIGVSYFLSAIGVYFRDIKDFVQVFSVVGVYLLPAFYLPEFVPSVFQTILYLNPFSYLIWCFQDVLYFGRFAHPWAWLVFTIMSLGVFTLGFRFFRKLQVMFGNVL